MKGIIGKKVGMAQIFDADGKVMPVTVIQAGPCFVTQVRTAERDGYIAMQLGFEEAAPEKLSRGELGHLRRAICPLCATCASSGSRTRLSKRASVLRWTCSQPEIASMSSGRAKGVALLERSSATTSIASRRHTVRLIEPARPVRAVRTTTLAASARARAAQVVWAMTASPPQNLEVMVVDAERNLLAVKGSVPGAKGGLVIIKASVKAR